MTSEGNGGRVKLSVVIIAKNEEAIIGDCIGSVAFADEIVLVDSGSSDGTVATAIAHGARVIHQPWLGYGAQKRFAVRHAAHDWVLCIDADERVSPELKASIQSTLRAPEFHAYEFPRRNRFLGRWLRHGEGYPDLSLRLFDRHYGQWSDDSVHEKVLCEGPVGRLAGDLLHESAERLSGYLEKQNRYTLIQAETLWHEGEPAQPWKIVVSPVVRFVKFYIVRLGFLDGWAGLVHIAIGCFNSFMKNAKLLELQRRKAPR